MLQTRVLCVVAHLLVIMQIITSQGRIKLGFSGRFSTFLTKLLGPLYFPPLPNLSIRLSILKVDYSAHTYDGAVVLMQLK